MQNLFQLTKTKSLSQSANLISYPYSKLTKIPYLAIFMQYLVLILFFLPAKLI